MATKKIKISGWFSGLTFEQASTMKLATIDNKGYKNVVADFDDRYIGQSRDGKWIIIPKTAKEMTVETEIVPV
jgi:hypothetical protein